MHVDNEEAAATDYKEEGEDTTDGDDPEMDLAE